MFLMLKNLTVGQLPWYKLRKVLLLGNSPCQHDTSTFASSHHPIIDYCPVIALPMMFYSFHMVLPYVYEITKCLVSMIPNLNNPSGQTQ